VERGFGTVSLHIIDLPLRVVVGSNIIDDIPRQLEDLGLRGIVLIVTGSTRTREIGKRVQEVLVDRGIDTFVVEVREATIDEARRVIEIAREVRASIAIGVGGGKAIDIAKYVASRIGAKFVSVPTAPSHDGIASPFASLKGFNRPTSVKAIMPILVVADIDIISSAPRRLIVAGCGDLIGKLSAVLDWRLAHKLRGEYYGEYAASLALLSAKHVIKYSEMFAKKVIPKEAVRALVEALISSGVAMGIAGSTRPASGSEHMFAHALDIVANYPALHGEEVGVGTIMMLYLHGRNWKKVRKVLKKIGAPTTAKELGVPPEKIVEALVKAHSVRPERYTILGEKGLTWEAAEKLAKVTGVID